MLVALQKTLLWFVKLFGRFAVVSCVNVSVIIVALIKRLKITRSERTTHRTINTINRRQT